MNKPKIKKIIYGALMLWCGFLGVNSMAHELIINGKKVAHAHYTGDGVATSDNNGTWQPNEQVNSNGHYRHPGDRHSRSDPSNPLSGQSASIIQGEQNAMPNATNTGPPTFAYNCHGYTFSITEGWQKCWVEDPKTVITEGHYIEIPDDYSHRWRFCDVVVYRDDTGAITHTGHVKQVTNGEITEMVSKNGEGGEWKHKPDDMKAKYGDWEVRRKCGVCINIFDLRNGKYQVTATVKVISATPGTTVNGQPIQEGQTLNPGDQVEVPTGGTVTVDPGTSKSGYRDLKHEFSGECPGEYTSYVDIVQGSITIEEYGGCVDYEHCGGATEWVDFWVDIGIDSLATILDVEFDSLLGYTTIYNSYESPDDIYFSPRSGPGAGHCYPLSPGRYAGVDSIGNVVYDVVNSSQGLTFCWYQNGEPMLDSYWYFDYRIMETDEIFSESHIGLLDFREKHPECDGQAVEFTFFPAVEADGWRQEIINPSGVSDVYAYNISNGPPDITWTVPDLLPALGVNYDTIYTAVNFATYTLLNPGGFDSGDWEIGQTLNDLDIAIVEGQTESCEGIYWAVSEFDVGGSRENPVPLGGNTDLLNSIDYPVDLLIAAAHTNRAFGGQSGCCNLPGDANDDDLTNIGDVVFTINYIFRAGPAPSCFNKGDVNSDCAYNVGDAVFLINYVFNDGPPPTCGCVE